MSSVGSAGRSKLLVILGLLLLMIIVPATAMWSNHLKIDVSVSTGSIDPGIYLFEGFLVEECHCGCLPKKIKLTKLNSNELHLSADGKYLVLQLSPRCDHHHRDETYKLGNNTFIEDRGRRECREYVLIGIIVRNYGTIPLKLWGVRVFELSSDNGRWSSKAFYYGPFSHIPPFWGRLTEVMRPPNNRSVPITLDPGKMAVIIVLINIKDKRSNYNLGIKPLFTQFNRSSK